MSTDREPHRWSGRGVDPDRRVREARQQSVNMVRSMPKGDDWIGNPKYVQSEQGVRTLKPGEAPLLVGELEEDPYQAMEQIAAQVRGLTQAVEGVLEQNGIDPNAPVEAQVAAQAEVKPANEQRDEAPPVAPASESPALIDFAAAINARASAPTSSPEPVAIPASFSAEPVTEAATG